MTFPGAVKQKSQRDELMERLQQVFNETMRGLDSTTKWELYPWGTKPDAFVVRSAEAASLSLGKKPTILDIGAGYGRNAIPLAKRGYEVTAIDRHIESIGQLRRDAALQGAKVNAIASNVISDGIRGRFDMILLIRVLHELPLEEARRLIAERQEHTNERGFNVVQMITFHADAEDSFLGFFHGAADLRGSYPEEEWNVLEYVGKEWAHNGGPASHIVAQRI